MIIYLAHGKSERKKGKEIQSEIEKLGIEVFNPFYSTEREDIHNLDAGLFTDNKEKGKAMIAVDSDLEGIRKSDIVVCIYPEREITIGVPCEMMYASMLNMPIISIGSDSILKHPWVIALSDGLFQNVEDLYLYLTTITKVGDDSDDAIIHELIESEVKDTKKKRGKGRN